MMAHTTGKADVVGAQFVFLPFKSEKNQHLTTSASSTHLTAQHSLVPPVVHLSYKSAQCRN